MTREEIAGLIFKLRRNRKYDGLSDYQVLVKAQKIHSDIYSSFFLFAFLFGFCWIYTIPIDLTMNLLLSAGMILSVSYGLWAFCAARRYKHASSVQ